MALAPNTILQNRYRIVRPLGQGGMGTVYDAVDERFDSQVALKEAHFTDDVARKQFEREARLLNRLRHPALTRVIDHFTEADGQFLVMDYVGGEDLWERLQKQSAPFPQELVLEWADQLLDALSYLHSQEPPVIHRDIKPHNLKLSDEGQILLLDFGLAKGTLGQSTSIRTINSVFGYTPVYAPFEQITGGGTDPRSDLYALCATLHHLLTGIPPIDAPTRYNSIEEGRGDPLRPAHRVNPAVKVEISEILWRAMAVKRKDRVPATAEMLRQDFKKANRSPAVEAKPAQPIPRESTPPIAKKTSPQPEGRGQTQQQRHPVSPTRFESPTTLRVSPVAASYFSPDTVQQPPSAPPATRRSRKWWIIGGVLVAIVAVALTFVLLRQTSLAERDRPGRVLRFQEKWAEAIAFYKEAVEGEPNIALWHLRLGQALRESGKQAEGLAEAREAERLAREASISNPDDAASHAVLGDSLRLQDRYVDAEAPIRRALQLNPNVAEYHVGLASAFWGQLKYADAENEFRQALKLDNDNGLARANLAKVLLAQRKYADAETEAREALKSNPRIPRVREALGSVLYEQSKFAEAETELREAIKLNPINSDYHTSLAVILIAEGRSTEAEIEAREGIRLNPRVSEKYYHLGRALFLQRKFAEAEVPLKKAIELSPKDAVNYEVLAYTLDALARPFEAEEAREKAEELKTGK